MSYGAYAADPDWPSLIVSAPSSLQSGGFAGNPTRAPDEGGDHWRARVGDCSDPPSKLAAAIGSKRVKGSILSKGQE